ncbi:hypothetical protein [Planotetraspora sp. GP83]|uniref:hypothetical protein n=1 Tax=Planotetraspora sp. GP83 TaxID=3156264 RepID=UPI003516AC21
MEGNTGFWLGLALSVPVGILVNVLTPLLQRTARRYSARRREEAQIRGAAERREAKHLADHPEKLNRVLLVAILRVTALNALATMVTAGPFWIADIISDTLGIAINLVIGVINVVTAVLVLNIARRWLTLARKADNISDIRGDDEAA